MTGIIGKISSRSKIINEPLTDGGVLLGSGDDAITATAVLADGEILIGDGTTDPVALDVGSSTAITALGTVATGTWEATDVAVAHGGTGASTLTANYALLGNGTSAPQMIAPSTSGNVLTSNGSTWASTAAAGGGLNHIITASVGTGANTGSTFTNFWSSSYKTYWIIMRDIGISHVAAVELRMQYHVNNPSGGTTAEGGAAYEVGLSGWTSDGSVYGVGEDGSTSIKICPNLGEETGRQYNAQFAMNGMSGVDTFCTIDGPVGWYHGSDYIVGGALAGHYSGNYATDFVGFQLILSAGTFNSGSVTIFGIKES